tara:strand:- start:9282 stop:9413 length:132 start_codon:yes stop_codon:yes gene_type:complete
MSPWAAKIFGFKRDIAHEFGVLAEAIEYLLLFKKRVVMKKYYK